MAARFGSLWPLDCGGGGGGAGGVEFVYLYGSYSSSLSFTELILLWSGLGAEGGMLGGEGAALLAGAGGGGGGGGAPDGAGLELGRGGGGEGKWRLAVLAELIPDGLRPVGGGNGGFLPIGGGGLGLDVVEKSGEECVDEGRRLFLNIDMEGVDGAAEGGRGGGAAPGRGGGPPLGLAGGGGLGVAAGFREFVSGSESYMFTPPVLFFSFGIPPANKPPSCGAASIPPPAPPEGCSELLLALFAVPAPPGGRSPPGIGGAPATGAAPESLPLSIMGADRSLTWVTFLSLAPDWMSPSKAPCCSIVSTSAVV
jgi:hypothetical protein